MISYAKRRNLFCYENMSEMQKINSQKNIQETNKCIEILESLPRRIILELTNACNLHCRMCGREAIQFKPTELNFDVVSWLEPYLNSIEEVTLMGWGEPTLYSKFTDLLCFLNNFSCHKYICTNGMLLEKYAKDIVNSNVDLLSISLNGATSKTNDSIRIGSSFEHIMSGVQAVNDAKKQNEDHRLLISFVYCIMRSNYHELPYLLDVADKYHVERVKVVHLTAFSKQMLNEIMWDRQNDLKEVFVTAAFKAAQYGIELELPYIQGEDPAGELKHGKCIAPWRDMFIGSDSILRPCMSSSQEIMGVNLSLSFLSHWNADTYQMLRKQINSDEMPEQCERCYQSSFCNWNKRKSYDQTEERYAHEWK